jgi:hypothetical protein
MSKWSVLLLLAVVASTNAIWLYSATSFNMEYTLFAINTDTYTVYKVGTVQDAAGDKFTVGGMHYDATTQLLYAIGNSRASNPLKDNGLFAINPLTAQGMHPGTLFHVCWEMFTFLFQFGLRPILQAAPAPPSANFQPFFFILAFDYPLDDDVMV